MRRLGYLNTLLTLITILLSLHLWTLWTVDGRSVVPEAAAAGLPDPSAQRQQTIDLLKQLNQKIENLIGLFTGGKARVRLEQTAGKADR